MSLQDHLDALKAQSAGKTPPDEAEISHRAIDELITTGAVRRARKVGEMAPAFTLNDSDGQQVDSRALLAKGPLVVTFYRGVWCPFCNLDLQALRDTLPDIEARGASLVSISPQTTANGRKAARTHNITYPLLSDPGGMVADAFGVRWKMPGDLVALYRDKYKLDLTMYNDDQSWTLPMPSRFVIGVDGMIDYAEVSPDYTVRPDPSELLPVLDRSVTRAA